MEKGFKDMSVRFFILKDEDDELDYFEVEEDEFLKADGHITYERHSIFENGVKQICLSKDNGM